MTKPVMAEMSPAMTRDGSLLADLVLPDLHLQLAGRERRRRRAAFLDVLVGLRFLLFLVAAHLTLGHDVPPCARLKDVARAEHSKCAGVCMRGRGKPAPPKSPSCPGLTGASSTPRP